MSDFDAILDSLNPEILGSTANTEEVLKDQDDPHEIVSRIIDDNINDIKTNIFTESRSVSRSRSRSRSVVSVKMSESKSKKEFLFHEYEDYIKNLENIHGYKGNLPKVSINDDEETIASAYNEVRGIYKEVNGGSLIHEICKFFNGALEAHFNGEHEVGRFKPDLTGWSDEFDYRTKTDASIKHAINYCGRCLPDNPLIIAGLKVGVGLLTHMQTRKRSMKTAGASDVNRVMGGYYASQTRSPPGNQQK